MDDSKRVVAVFDPPTSGTCWRNYDEGARCGRPKGHEGACSQVSRWVPIDEASAMRSKKAFWIFRLSTQGKAHSVVGPACTTTVEAALRLANLTTELCGEIRASAVVRRFVEDKLDADRIYRRHGSGNGPPWPWYFTIEVVDTVLGAWCPTCEGPHDDEQHRTAREGKP